MRDPVDSLRRRSSWLVGRGCAAFALLALAGSPLGAATIAVTSTQDDETVDSLCTLREAIDAANGDVAHHGCASGSGADRIVFSLATPATITLVDDLPLVTDTLLIRGPGADLLTIDGQDQFSLVRAFSGGSARFWMGVEDVTLTNGLAVGGYGGAVEFPSRVSGLVRRVAMVGNHAPENGGGVSAIGIDTPPTLLEVESCWFAGNDAKRGGGLAAEGDQLGVHVDRTTFYGNTATGDLGDGGGLHAYRSTTRLTSSTFSGNTAADFGAGVSFRTDSLGVGSLDIRDSTITLNVSDGDHDGTGGGAVAVTSIVGEAPPALGLDNTIVAGNLDSGVPAEPDVSIPAGPVTVTGTFDLIGSNAGATSYFSSGSPNAGGSYVGTDALPINPRLEALALYNGVLPTHRPSLTPLSPAVDAGFCPDAIGDQRGFGDAANHVRVVDIGGVPDGPSSDGCDIGSHERGGSTGADVALFVDGFENGHTLIWSDEAP